MPAMARMCPTCGEPAEWEGNPDRPFCSDRCRMIDLGRWASEDYRIPIGPADPGGPAHERTGEYDREEE